MWCAHKHAEMLLREKDGNLGLPALHSMFHFDLNVTDMQAKTENLPYSAHTSRLIL